MEKVKVKIKISLSLIKHSPTNKYGVGAQLHGF